MIVRPMQTKQPQEIVVVGTLKFLVWIATTHQTNKIKLLLQYHYCNKSFAPLLAYSPALLIV